MKVVVPFLGIAILAVAVAAMVAILILGIAVLLLLRRRGRADPEARSDLLADLGYAQAGAGRWSQPVEDASLTFEDAPDGWRWTVRLPRYNTMSLVVEERSAPEATSVSSRFPSGIHEIDERFVLGSPLAAQTLPLIANRGVAMAMLSVPHLAVRLGADELAIVDRGHRGLTKLAKGAAIGTPAALAAEREIHQLVLVLVNQMFRCLYSRATGTIMDDFR
jgi:hypothetical protein